MSVAYVRTYLRMTSPDQLRPADEVAGLFLERTTGASPVLRELFVRVGRPHHWPHVNATPDQWVAAMAVKGLQHWLVTSYSHPVGLVSLQPQEGGRVELVSFGLAPHAQGHGRGGDALANYQRRGFQPCCTEPRRKEVPHPATDRRPVTVSALGE